MFNTKKELSLLKNAEEIISADYCVGYDQKPIITFVSARSKAIFLCFLKYDGEKWGFNDFKYKISKTNSFVKTLETESFIYFLYDYKNGSEENRRIDYIKFSKQEEKFSNEINLDVGNIQHGYIFEYEENVLFFYVKDNITYIKDESGDFLSSIPSFTIPNKIIEKTVCVNNNNILLSWSYQDDDDVNIDFNILNVVEQEWIGVTNISKISNYAHSLTCVKNNDKDLGSSDYIAFGMVINTNTPLYTKMYMLTIDFIGNFSKFSVYNKKYIGTEEKDIKKPITNFSLYNKEAIIYTENDEKVILYAEDFNYGFVKKYYPNNTSIDTFISMVPYLDENGFQYIIINDNIRYGYSTRSERYGTNKKYIICSGDDIYVGNFPVLTSVYLLDFIYDKNFNNPFLWVLKKGDKRCYLYNSQEENYLTSFTVNTSLNILKMRYDELNGNALIIYDNDTFFTYNIQSKISRTFSFFNNVRLGKNLNINIHKDKIYICDPDNNRIVIISRNDFSFLGSLNINFINNAYNFLIDYNSFIYVRGYNEDGDKNIYKLNNDGSLVNIFPSFSEGELDDPAHFSTICNHSYKAAFIFNNSSILLVIDTQNNFYYFSNIEGYILKGVEINSDNGNIIISSEKEGKSFVMDICPFSLKVISIRKVNVSGRFYEYKDSSTNFSVPFISQKPKYSFSDNEIFKFKGVKEEILLIPEESVHIEHEDVGVTVFNPQKQVEIHSDTKKVKGNLVHFRNTGIGGVKTNIDKTLSHVDYIDGELTKIPVFCWSFNEYYYIDTFFMTDGYKIKKIALWDDKKEGEIILKEVDSFNEVNLINNIFVEYGNVFISAGGYISILSYNNLNRDFFNYFVNDIKVYLYHDDKVYLGSKSLGYVWISDGFSLENCEMVEVKDAPVDIKWCDYLNKFIIHCDNSLKTMSLDNQVDTFYDINGYVIKEILIRNNFIFIALGSYETIPFAGNYEDLNDFNIDIQKRKVDKIVIYCNSKNEVVEQYNMPYNFVFYSMLYSDDFYVMGKEEDGVSIKRFVDENIYSMYYESIAIPVKLIYLPFLNKNIGILSDKNLITWDNESIFDFEYTNKGLYLSSVYMASNGLLVNRDDINIQEGGSSSSSSSSSNMLEEKTLTVQIIVGDSYGYSNKWDSGEIETDLRCIIYGGGNNLEPGQQYYVSIRCKDKNENWSLYTGHKFITPNFNNDNVLEVC